MTEREIAEAKRMWNAMSSLGATRALEGTPEYREEINSIIEGIKLAEKQKQEKIYSKH